jgi:hypothetical protein
MVEIKRRRGRAFSGIITDRASEALEYPPRIRDQGIEFYLKLICARRSSIR